MTQTESVLEYLKAGNSITPLEALNKFGCFRLSAIIFDLKQQGFNIKTEIINKGRKHFASYRIAPRLDPPGQQTLFGGGL